MQNTQQPYDYQKRVVIFGDSGVGKTSILLRYRYNTYEKYYCTTGGLDFILKTVGIADKLCRLQIWDTAGQERFRTITSPYFRSASGIIIVYDVTNRNSFNSIPNHLQYIQNIVANLEPQYYIQIVQYMLIGSKIDLIERQVSIEEGQQLADQNNLIFFEVSSLTSENVVLAFETLAARMIQHQNNSRSIQQSMHSPSILLPSAPTKRYNCI